MKLQKKNSEKFNEIFLKKYSSVLDRYTQVHLRTLGCKTVSIQHDCIFTQCA